MRHLCNLYKFLKRLSTFIIALETFNSSFPCAEFPEKGGLASHTGMSWQSALRTQWSHA